VPKSGSTLALIAPLLWAAICGAAEVDLQVVGVSPGQSAEISISGGSPITIGIGETIEGVTVLSADRRGAVVRSGGIARTLPLVAYRSSTGGAGGGGYSITLLAGPSGQFLASGAVNGSPMQFVVDTGATWVALSRSQAKRMGINYTRGTPTLTSTANGIVRGWRLKVDSVRIGDATERDVDAVVLDGDSGPVGLLGMSYLNRFDMQRQGKTLVLRRR